MKKLIFLFLYSVLLFTSPLFSWNKQNTSSIKTETQSWIKNQPVRFLENRGQMTDMAGQPIPFVLFKIDAPGVDLFITEQGLTYVFKTNREEKAGSLESEAVSKEASTPLSLGEGSGGEVSWERIDMTLKGASIKKENIIKENPMQGHFNYFYPHCSNGIYGVKEYGKITIKDIYPGIDWVFYNSTNKGLKYDFVVHPGADHKQIQLVYSSKEKLSISPTGTLEAKTKYGNLSEHAPETFYEGQLIASNFKHLSTMENKYGGYDVSIGFDIPNFVFSPFGGDREGAYLIIDPQLVWATFYGGNSIDGPMSMDTDNEGNVFITGYTGSADFPVQDAGTFFQGTHGSGTDAFILKFDNAGTYIWGTFYGSSGGEWGHSITTDNDGNVFVTGMTISTDFPMPTTGTIFQPAHGGGYYDAFILKFDNLGNRLWATFYGGTDSDIGNSITTDNDGDIFITGKTISTDFPVKDAGTFFQGTYGGGSSDAFMLKFDNAGNRLWASYYGGTGDDSGNSLATDTNSNVFVTGYTFSTNFPVQDAGTFFQETSGGGLDVFILKFDNLGNRLWATYYGGSGLDGTPEHFATTDTDDNGNVFVTGITKSRNFPVQDAGTFFQGTYGGGDSDVFMLKFDNLGNRLWATYYGNLGDDEQSSNDNLTIDACGNIYMSFETTANNMSTQASCDIGGYHDNAFNFSKDIFLTRFSNTGVLLWASYLGGDGDDFRSPMATDAMGNLFVSGEWSGFFGPITSTTYPLTNLLEEAYFDSTFNGDDDGFILKFVTASSSDFTNSLIVLNDSCCNGSATVNISGGCEPYNYFWSTGKQTVNTSSLTDSLNHLCAGTYWFIAESACSIYNDADTIYFTIAPLQECEVIVPNIFTPNGDSTNDYFVLKDIEKHPEHKLIIFNRWGEKIQEFQGYKNTWTADGIIDGVYYYVLYLSDNHKPKTGFIMIER